MSLELVLLPVSQEYEKETYEIEQKIKKATKTLNTLVDTNYKTSLYGKITKYRKTDKDIIVVDHEYSGRNKLSIRFSDKGSRPEMLSLDDLIDLLVSLEDDDEVENIERKFDTSEKRETSETKDEKTKDEKAEDEKDSKEGGCVVM
jgi:hypothetical protein